MPSVSVILPVYNAAPFLKEAIDSILVQTLTDFELLLINDGSTDGSESIIESYADERIRYIKNVKNCGLIFSLNKGIEMACGEWIARMDADDIALPQRLEKQVSFLSTNSVDLLATTVKLIDKDGRPLADWKDDIANTTACQIKKFLPKNNCIAHPTVMGRAKLFKKYKYQPDLTGEYKYVHNQKYSEDYDLWLRLSADGVIIEKLTEPLLFYRVLTTSITRYRKVNIFYRLANVKFRFFRQQLKNGQLSSFNCAVFLYACLDLVKAVGKEVKALLK
ncbi:MAG: glycosyltransferase [Flavisolibacter sp.]|nr:glycosyltransferase [Flavisolibacter sp.]